MGNRFQKLPVIALILIATGCGPLLKQPGTGTTETPAVAKVTATTRQDAIAKIEESLRKKPEQRVFKAPGDHGWIEEHELVNVEDIGIEPVRAGKPKIPMTQMTVRITSKVTRWKTYGGKKKGEPNVRQTSTIRRYNF